MSLHGIITVGEGQSLGNPFLSFGGPYLGFFASGNNKYLRKMPGPYRRTG